MRPINFKKEEGVTHFHYKFSELRSFLSHGFKHGDNGWILTKREGNLCTYKGFGTIENPSKSIRTISIEHCESYDGKSLTDDQIISNSEKEWGKVLISHSFAILNLSDDEI